MEITTHTKQGVNKVGRYRWTTKDQPGTLQMVPKEMLHIDQDYQRELAVGKVKEITSEWSWLACGAITVADRGGDLYVIDGQHRVASALRRSDIHDLPCVIFRTQDQKEEAAGFLDANTNRRPVSSIAKHRASLVSGDPAACTVERILQKAGIKATQNSRLTGTIKSLAWCHDKAKVDESAFEKVLMLVADIALRDDMQVPEKVLDGVFQLHFRVPGGLNDKRLVAKIKEKGCRVLLEAANRAASYHARGGGKVWAQGIFDELNRGLRNRFVAKFDDPKDPK